MRIFGISLALWAGLSGAALAELTICNDTDDLQSIALGYKGETDWSSKGWWNVAPGDCAVVVSGDLKKRYYYYHADSDGDVFRGQDYLFCTQDKVFEIEGDTDCADRGFLSTEFREIDTGETATTYTLRLVSNSGSTGGSAKAPGGGAETGGELGTQEMTETPVAPDVTVSVAALETDLPEGRHGDPFEMVGVFQGCELESGRAYCGFHSGGIKYRAFYNGPTPDDLMFALEELDVNTPLRVIGDMAETRGQERAVVMRSVQPSPGTDRFATTRAALQGDWVRARDRLSEITIHGSEIYRRHKGKFKSARYIEIADKCDGLRGAGPVLLERAKGSTRPKCFRIVQANRRLELVPVRGGDTLNYRRP